MDQNHKRKVRIWIPANGSYVKVTLHHGRVHSWGFFEWTDEGYTSRAYKWVYDANEGGGAVYLEVWDESRDCDGRYSHHWEGVATDLAAIDAYSEPWIKLPEFKELDSLTRDHTAEAEMKESTKETCWACGGDGFLDTVDGGCPVCCGDGKVRARKPARLRVVAIMVEGEIWCPEHGMYDQTDIDDGYVTPVTQSDIDCGTDRADWLKGARCASHCDKTW